MPPLVPQAQAALITGGISFGGSYKTDTGNINTANAFTSFPFVFVVSCSGDYSSVPVFTSVTQKPFFLRSIQLPNLTALDLHEPVAIPIRSISSRFRSTNREKIRLFCLARAI